VRYDGRGPDDEQYGAAATFPIRHRATTFTLSSTDRLVAPVRVPASAVGDPVRIKLLGFAHRFARGHSVRLTLCTTDEAYYNNQSPDTVTVTTGPGSTFRLPTR
jgi:hypothetical protein